MRRRSTTNSNSVDSADVDLTSADSASADSTEARIPLSRRLREGVEGGFVATLAMTAYRMPISRSPPPTARFWSEFVAGGDPGDHAVPGLVLHLFYGTVGGALFGAVVPERGADEAEREGLNLLLGVGYAVALSIFGERVVLNRVLGMDLDADEALVFHVGHVVYGLSLGTWLGSRASEE